MNKRIEHIDVARGISIVLVAMYHSNLRDLFPGIVEPMSVFRMPLFFFLSGMFFSYSLSPKLFIIKKSEELLKPYFSVLLFLLFISFCLSEEDILWQFKYILYSNGTNIRWLPMWFLTHLFAVYVFSYILFRYFAFYRFTFVAKWIILLFSLIIGVLNIDILWGINLSIFGNMMNISGLPFSLDIILITSVFFISGNILKKYTLNFTPNSILFYLSIVIYLFISFFTESHISLILRTYDSPIFSTLGAVCGIYIVMCVSYSIARYKNMKNIFIILGRSSLFILIFHLYIGDETYLLLDDYVTGESSMVLLSFIAFIFSISFPLIIKLVVTNNSILAQFFLPFKSQSMGLGNK